MNRRVLLVGPWAHELGTSREWLEVHHHVVLEADPDEAFARLERDGPFAVVLAEHGPTADPSAVDGLSFLAHLQRVWPDSVRILVTHDAGAELAAQAVQRGEVFRLMTAPPPVGVLQAALEDALERFRQIASERLLAAQLEFSRESLLSLTETLEYRLASQAARMRDLHRFAFDLGRARSLDEVAERTAHAACEVLDGRGVEVVLDDGDEDGVTARAGPPLQGELQAEPILTADGELGHLRVSERSPTGQELLDGDRQMLEAVAASAALAAGSERHRRAREVAHHATIYGLARLAEYRDDETGRHLDRVAAYCKLIALGLREDGEHAGAISDGFVQDIALSAPLHDIGKVGIPDSILLKPGKLTEDEWIVMRKHPLIGAETLRNVLETSGEQSFLRMAHEIAWCHHEKWDGSGYPRGLVGEETPLAARIMAVADCYDALTNWRPYKEAWSHERALEYVREERGRHFDPTAADAFLRRADAVDEIRRQLADERDSASVA